MNKVIIILLGLVLGGLFANAKSISDNDNVKALEVKYSIFSYFCGASSGIRTLDP